MKMKLQERPSHSNRMPERWFRRALWLVAVVFAAFLIGLGGKIVGELPTVSQYKELHDYIDRNRFDPLEKEREALAKRQHALAEAMEQARLALDKQQAQTRKEQERFDNWLAARTATEQSSQNPEVIRQTRALDELKDKEQQLQQKIDALNQQQLDGNQRFGRIQTQIDLLEQQAQERKTADDRRIELKTFLYRLALTLPLLAAAGYLFAKQRQSRWWPFVWGFIYFALFAFFVELVPYLPSYGGYVRYIVGIIITVLVGRYAITAMNRYLERKKAEEALPSNQRQQQMSYDAAQLRISKSICPGCERQLNYQQPDMDYCPHCGINLFDYCSHCKTRKSAFNRYCACCGHAAGQSEAS